MSSKSSILARIRKNLPVASPLPDMRSAGITFADREQQFIDTLISVGGHVQRAATLADVPAIINELACAVEVKKTVCTIAELPLGNVDFAALDDPHTLADVDLAILHGQFGVAENAAVWVTDIVRHRAIYFIAQHIVLVLPRSEIVDNMHLAYDRLEFDGPGYGVFIAGPSKTADIEQSLVIGAHGARSHTVILLG